MNERKVPKIVVAYERDRGIGLGSKLLWEAYEMSTDMARFRRLTRQAGCIIIGRNSLINDQIDLTKRPFPKVEQVIVLTSQSRIEVPGVEVADSIERALEIAHVDPLVVGGGQAYRSALPYADTVYATEVHASIPHDEATRFPELPASEWRETERIEFVAGKDPDHPRKQDLYDSAHVTYIRK